MLDSIINSVKGEIGSSLMEKFGLDANQKDKAFNITEETLKEKIKGEATGSGLGGVINLFSSSENNPEGNLMLDSLGGDLIASFTSKLGIGEDKAAEIKDMILARVTSLIGDKLGSDFNASALLSLIGEGKAKDVGGLLGKVGGLFKKR